MAESVALTAKLPYSASASASGGVGVDRDVGRAEARVDAGQERGQLAALAPSSRGCAATASTEPIVQP